MKSYYQFQADFADAFKGLSDAEELQLRRMIDAYGIRREDPPLEKLATMPVSVVLAWPAIRKALETNWKRTENGRKGGAPVGNRNAEKQKVTPDKNNQKQPKTTKNNQNVGFVENQGVTPDKNNQKQPKTTKNNQTYTPTLPSPRAREINTIINNNVNNNVNTHINAREARVCVHEPEGSTTEENGKLKVIEDEFARYTAWLKKEHPYYADPENCEVLTLYQWHRLRQEYDLETIARATEDLDGRADYKRRGQVGSHFTYLRAFCENIKRR